MLAKNFGIDTHKNYFIWALLQENLSSGVSDKATQTSLLSYRD